MITNTEFFTRTTAPGSESEYGSISSYYSVSNSGLKLGIDGNHMAKNEAASRAAMLKEKEIFCTECGEFLENFCFSSGAEDINAIKKTLAQCKKDGKFVGDFCAKLFIVDREKLDSLWDEDSVA